MNREEIWHIRLYRPGRSAIVALDMDPWLLDLHRARGLAAFLLT